MVEGFSSEEEVTKVGNKAQDPVSYLIGEVATFRGSLSEMQRGIQELTKKIELLAHAVQSSTDASMVVSAGFNQISPLVDEHTKRFEVIEAKCLRQHSNGKTWPKEL